MAYFRISSLHLCPLSFDLKVDPKLENKIPHTRSFNQRSYMPELNVPHGQWRKTGYPQAHPYLCRWLAYLCWVRKARLSEALTDLFSYLTPRPPGKTRHTRHSPKKTNILTCAPPLPKQKEPPSLCVADLQASALQQELADEKKLLAQELQPCWAARFVVSLFL